MKNYMLETTWLKLLGEADRLRKNLTNDVAKDIESGYETGGGWHDNALYESALTDQVVVASKLLEISRLLQHPTFIEGLEISGDTVTIGVKITIKRGGEQEKYKLLGQADAKYDETVLQINAPLAKCLLGHKRGETVQWRNEQLEILQIEKLF